MEIRIKTPDEFLDDRVVIEVSGTPAEAREAVDRLIGHQTYSIEALRSKVVDLEKALTLATTSREFNRKRVVELENQLNGSRTKVRHQQAAIEEMKRVLVAERDQGTKDNKRIAELEADIARRIENAAELERQRDGLRAEVETLSGFRAAHLIKIEGYDQDRKTERDRADENQARAERAEALLERAQGKLNEIKKTLDNPAVKAELDKPVRINILASALRSIRDIVNP